MKAPPRVRVYIPSVEEVHVLVQRALRERVPIDRLATDAIFAGRKPKKWGDWPSHARDAWEGIVAVYMAERAAAASLPQQRRVPGLTGGRPTLYPEVSTARAWAAVQDSMAHAPEGVRLTWPDLSQRLGMSRRAAQHQLLGRLGFSFHGQGKVRVLVSGPCLICRNTLPVSDLKDCVCAACQT